MAILWSTFCRVFIVVISFCLIKAGHILASGLWLNWLLMSYSQFMQNFGLSHSGSSVVCASAEQMVQVLGLLQALVGCPSFRQLQHFSGRGICGRTLSLSYPIKVSGGVVDPKVTVMSPDSFRILFLMIRIFSMLVTFCDLS